MKKLIALLLAAAMLLTMTACGGDAKSAETAAPTAATEASTEPVETEPGIYYPADSEIAKQIKPAKSRPKNKLRTAFSCGRSTDDPQGLDFKIGKRESYFSVRDFKRAFVVFKHIAEICLFHLEAERKRYIRLAVAAVVQTDDIADPILGTLEGVDDG